MTGPSHWERGRLVTAWIADPTPVHGGWTVRFTRWVRTDAGWDQEDLHMATPEHVTTKGAAVVAAAILNMRPDWVAEAAGRVGVCA